MTDDRGSPWPLKVAYILAGLGLPSVVAAARWHFIQAHPLPGSMLLAGLAAGLGVSGFAYQVWARKYRDRFIDTVASIVDLRTTTFWRQFRSRMLNHVRYVDQRGLLGYIYDPELNDVYVDVTLQHVDSPRVSPSALQDLPTVGERHTIGEFLGKPQPRVIAIIGAPGSGKTTLLRHTASRLCQARRVPRDGRGVPILLYLRDHVRAISANPDVTLLTLMNDTVHGRFGLTDTSGWMQVRLDNGGCVVMLDGLDEVAQAEDRKLVAEWVRQQTTLYPDNDFLVTSRPLGYQSAPIEGAIRVLTQPFTAEQVERFIHRWYLAEERRGVAHDDQETARKATDLAQDLIGRLRTNPALHALTVNPLLLTMIATVHRHLGALPGSRSQLYEQICQVLLWRRQEAKKLPAGLSGDQKQRIIRLLGYEMMTREIRDISVGDATRVLRPVLRELPGVSTGDILTALACTGLFIERENGFHAFAHMTFQEYVAAAHIKEQRLERTLLRNVAVAWWRQTTLLYVANADASAIVSACLAENSLTALALAFECAAEAQTLSPELRDTLEKLRADGLRPGADPALRKLMIGVTLTRQLSEVADTGGGVVVCTKPITSDIYRLFLDDMAAKGTPMPPDAPGEPPADPQAVAHGMRGTDALAFSQWANLVTDGQLDCHLASADDMREYARQQSPDASRYWTLPANDGDLPVLVPAGRSPWQLEPDVMQNEIDAEFVNTPLALCLFPLAAHLCAAVGADSALAMLQRAAMPGQHALLRELLGQTLPALTTSVRNQRSFARAETAGRRASRNTARGNSTLAHLTQKIDRDIDAMDALIFGVYDPVTDQTRISREQVERELQLARDLGFTTEVGWSDAGKPAQTVVAPFLGSCLGPMVEFARWQANSPAAVAAALAAAFASAANLSPQGLRPEVLPEACNAAVVGIRGLVMLGDLRRELVIHVVDQFAVVMADINRRELSAGYPLVVRGHVLASCLAAEASARGDDDLAEVLRQIATTILWQHRRRKGLEPAPETILLARG